jgi:hypothetical protein
MNHNHTASGCIRQRFTLFQVINRAKGKRFIHAIFHHPSSDVAENIFDFSNIKPIKGRLIV